MQKNLAYNVIAEQVKGFIVKQSFNGAKNLDEGTQIFKEGILDSMGFLMLLDFMKESFGMELKDEELVEKNFESVKTIAEFVETKLALP